MKKYRIVFAPTALKQFQRLTKIIQLRISQAITKLANDPFIGKQLKWELKDYRSYRVGDYRIVYLIHCHKIQIEIIHVAHRKEVYR